MEPFWENSKWLKAFNSFWKKFYHRCLIGSSTRKYTLVPYHWYQVSYHENDIIKNNYKKKLNIETFSQDFFVSRLHDDRKDISSSFSRTTKIFRYCCCCSSSFIYHQLLHQETPWVDLRQVYNKALCLELGKLFCRRVFVARFVVSATWTTTWRTNIAFAEISKNFLKAWS